jgi:vacuolar iron transporter family protein
MPQTPHIAKHFTVSETVRDIVIGMSDGLTVPIAMATGPSGAVNSTSPIITAGITEASAGAIGMDLDGYLAARTDTEYFAAERCRDVSETRELPEVEAAKVAQAFRGYGLPEDKVTAVVGAILSDRKRWVDFLMTFELGMEEPDPRRTRSSALTIALSYVAGGLVPLAPYFLFRSVHVAIIGSAIVTLLALFVFGFVKGRFTTNRPLRSAGQTVLVGGLAAAATFRTAMLFR